jgi:hypothetical protein
MGSYKRPKNSYTAEELDQLQWVFDSVWSTVQVRYPFRDKADDEKLKGTLRRKLFALACGGILEPAALETHLLDSIPRGYDLPLPPLTRTRRRSFI